MPWELWATLAVIGFAIIAGVIDARRLKREWNARPRKGEVWIGKPKTEPKEVEVWVENSYRLMSGSRFVVFSWTSQKSICCADSMDLDDFVKAFRKVNANANPCA